MAKGALIEVEGASLGVFKIHSAVTKPIIAKRNEGKDQTIKNGEVYYRYAGRTQKRLFRRSERGHKSYCQSGWFTESWGASSGFPWKYLQYIHGNLSGEENRQNQEIQQHRGIAGEYEKK